MSLPTWANTACGFYAPQHHKPGKVHQSKAIAETDTDDEPADWSVQPDPVADQHA